MQGFFDIPVDHLYALPVIARYLNSRENLEPFIAVSPDVGGFKMTASYAQALHVGLATVFKKRKSDTEVDSLEIIGDVRDKNVLLVDDLTTTAGTLTSAARLCKENGARDVYASVTHAVLTDMAIARFDKSEITEVITTNTVPIAKGDAFQRCKITTLCISELLGEAMKRIHGDQSVSSLFDIGPQ